jgi:hypothetical protein
VDATIVLDRRSEQGLVALNGRSQSGRDREQR